jgi:hypothetical protein
MKNQTLELYGTKVLFEGFQWSKYADGNDALLVILQWPPSDGGEKELYRLSVNIPSCANLLKEDTVFVKDWAEGEAPVNELLRLGLLEYVEEIPPVASGYVLVPAARLTMKGKSYVIESQGSSRD